MFDHEEILLALQSWQRGSIFIYIFQLIIYIGFIISAILICKYALTVSKKTKTLIVSISSVIFLFFIVVYTVNFVNICKEIKNEEYIVENDATIYVYEESSSFIDNYVDIELTTSDGQTVLLKLHSSYSMSNDETYTGCFVYTKRSKELILYKLFDQ